MAHAIDRNRLIKQIDQLTYSDKVTVMEQILRSLKQGPVKTKSHSITKLRGLGKEIWSNIDIDSYLSEQRESWD